MRNVGYNQARQYLIDKAKGLPGELLQNLIGSLFPFGGNFSAALFEDIPTKSGGKFEDALTLNLFGLIGGSYSNYLESLHFQVPVFRSGNPAGDGFGCVVSINRPLTTPGTERGYRPAKPDFIIKQGGPQSTDHALNSQNPKAYLIGDITRSLDEVKNKVQSSGQGQATLNYARYGNNHQYSPIALYVTLFGGDRSTYEKAVKYGLERYGVVVLAAPILANVHP